MVHCPGEPDDAGHDDPLDPAASATLIQALLEATAGRQAFEDYTEQLRALLTPPTGTAGPNEEKS